MLRDGIFHFDNDLRRSSLLLLTFLPLALLHTSCGDNTPTAPTEISNATVELDTSNDNLDMSLDGNELAGTSTATKISSKTANISSAIAAATSSDTLPVCADARIGRVQFRRSDAKFFYCDINGWNEIDLRGDKGAQGSIGAQGTTGAKGAQGRQGEQGPQGPQGAQGATGPQGLQGPRGDDGPVGGSGPVGAMGPAGGRGATGDAGITGAVGQKGNKGAQGPEGPAPQGVKGDTGPQGPQGIRGVQGVQGPKGDTGVVGDAGPQGPKGPQGPQGIQGLAGAAGPTGFDGLQGPQGDQGLQGIQGVQGDQGPKGVAGDTGDQGPQGLPGAQGDQGPQGPQGAKGATGDTGAAGVVGDAGVQGSTGAQGDPGLQGDTGADGKYILVKDAKEMTTVGRFIAYGNPFDTTDQDTLLLSTVDTHLIFALQQSGFLAGPANSTLYYIGSGCTGNLAIQLPSTLAFPMAFVRGGTKYKVSSLSLPLVKSYKDSNNNCLAVPGAGSSGIAVSKTYAVTETTEIAASYLTPLSIGLETDFLPKVTDLKLWLVADDLRDGGLSSDDTVSQWINRPDTGIMLQSNTSQRPLLKTGANAIHRHATVLFDGTDNFMSMPYTGTIEAKTIFIVTKLSDLDTQPFNGFLGGTILSHESISGYEALVYNNNDARRWGFIATTPTSKNFSANADETSTAPILLTLTADASGGFTLYKNGAQIGTKSVAPAATSSGIFILGQRGGSTFTHYRGSIAEIVFYNVKLSTTDRLAAESYLKEKYGL
ncbi:MAG: hypothetical protein KA436_09235 [Oligoflexales bacterium]|nr:hypothetical protein [Oligoflexales bacterium]